MEKYLENFVFEEHILRIDDLRPRIEKLEKLISSPFSFPIRFLLKHKLKHLEFHQKYSYERYDNIRETFYAITDNTKNQVTFNPSNKIVTINGGGSELFKCNGNPVFYHSKTGEETLIPVRIGIDNALLRIHRHPQLIISPFDDFNIDYEFSTNFSLGDSLFDYFTPSQTKTRKSFLQDITSLDKTKDDLFCGQPGRVFYRFCDALYEELSKSVFCDTCNEGSLPHDYFARRQKLNIYGTISIKDSGALLYQGDFKVYNTYFPFFIRGSNDGNREKIPMPKTDVSIE